jgi:Heterokaryon incompatibility protein Het-C
MNRNVKIHLVSAALFALVLPAGPASAFKVGKLEAAGTTFEGTAIHEEITQSALRSEVQNPQYPGEVQFKRSLSNGTVISFSQKAVDQIILGNQYADSLWIDLPQAHFDDDSFIAANSRLMTLRAAIANAAIRAAAGNYKQGFAGVRETLGMALHSVQDFYAHSNWVERGGVALAPLGRTNAGLQTGEQIGSTCTFDNLIPGAPLTTGYFDVTQLTNNISWTYDWMAPSGVSYDKCKHGFSFGAGLNKDGPGRANHELAKTLAIGATAQFVNDVLGDLAGNDRAICGLMTDLPADPNAPNSCEGLTIKQATCSLTSTGTRWVITGTVSSQIAGVYVEGSPNPGFGFTAGTYVLSSCPSWKGTKTLTGLSGAITWHYCAKRAQDETGTTWTSTRTSPGATQVRANLRNDAGQVVLQVIKSGLGCPGTFTFP